jgi:hypothetical protein
LRHCPKGSKVSDMAEFLCRGYKCACGKMVKVTQVQKPNPLPTGSADWLGGLAVRSHCGKRTFIARTDFVEWNEEVTVN